MYDVIIIGAGPSGLMTAIQIDKNVKTLILEKNEKSGKKLLITGGGRCNVTNLKSNNDFLNQIEHNRKYLYSTINNFGPQDVYDFFSSNSVKLKEEEDNRIFPVSNKSIDILNVLLNNLNNTKIEYSTIVKEIIYEENNIKVITNKGKYITKKLVIATGGTSFKKTGSSGDHIKFAKMLNHKVVDLYPVETGIILKEKLDLVGISLDSVIGYCNKKTYEGNLIFTHKGLSGSVIMKMSEHIYLNNIKSIEIDFLKDYTQEEFRNIITNYNREKELITLLSNYLPKRLCYYLIEKSNLNSNIKIKNLTKTQILTIANNIKKSNFEIDRVCDIDCAYVTGGGIDMKYINTKTMESKVKKGIYFVGECLDIHGPIGGYNITLALSAGYTAGINIGVDSNEKK